MEFSNIPIEKLRQMGLQFADCFRDDLIMTSQIENENLFHYPCRIDAITILICVKGKIDCSVDLRHYTIHENGIMIIFPENIIQIHNMEAVKAYALLISTTFLDELHIRLKERSNSYLVVKREPLTYVPYDEIVNLKSYYRLIRGNIYVTRPENKEIIKGLIQSFAYTIISLKKANQVQQTEKTERRQSRKQYIFERFMKLLSQYHQQERNVSFYADKICLTANHMSSVIKECSGQTAIEWINKYVILEAKMLLRFSELSICEIAYRLNFSSQSAFGKYFKQQTGVSPKFYIEESKK